MRVRERCYNAHAQALGGFDVIAGIFGDRVGFAKLRFAILGRIAECVLEWDCLVARQGLALRNP